MTPTEERAFIALWNEDLETAAIAARLGIKAGTAQSCAHRLQQRGLIQRRPRGGTYPAQRRQAALAGVSAGTPGVSIRVSGGVSRRTPPASRLGGVGALEPAPLRPAARAQQSHGHSAGATG
jgi:hypothetical protein